MHMSLHLLWNDQALAGTLLQHVLAQKLMHIRSTLFSFMFSHRCVGHWHGSDRQLDAETVSAVPDPSLSIASGLMVIRPD